MRKTAKLLLATLTAIALVAGNVCGAFAEEILAEPVHVPAAAQEDARFPVGYAYAEQNVRIYDNIDTDGDGQTELTMIGTVQAGSYLYVPYVEENGVWADVIFAVSTANGLQVVVAHARTADMVPSALGDVPELFYEGHGLSVAVYEARYIEIQQPEVETPEEPAEDEEADDETPEVPAEDEETDDETAEEPAEDAETDETPEEPAEDAEADDETPEVPAEDTEADNETPEEPAEDEEADDETAEVPVEDAETDETPEEPAEDAEADDEPAEEPAEDAEADDEPAEEPAEDAETDDEPAEDEETDDETAEEPVEEFPPFTCSVRILLVNEGDIYFGDEIILRAVVDGASAPYSLRWEMLDRQQAGAVWTPIPGATDEEYRFVICEENQDFEYRVVITAAE